MKVSISLTVTSLDVVLVIFSQIPFLVGKLARKESLVAAGTENTKFKPMSLFTFRRYMKEAQCAMERNKTQ